jgi:large subunit ribosomal protein L31e
MAQENKQQLKTEEITDEELEAELNEEEAAVQEPAEAKPSEQEAAEEVKPKKKKKEEDEFVEERIYTIPLQKANIRPPKKRSPRAMQLLKIFLVKHMKLDVHVDEDEDAEELPQLIVAPEVNEKIWSKGIEKPPRRIRVRAAKDKDGNVTVFLAENQ